MLKISESRALLFAALAVGFIAVSAHAAEQQRPRLSVTMKATNYAIESVAAAEEGTTLVELGIGIDGAVTDVVLQQSSGHPRLDEASIVAARSLKLSTPPMRGGVPVAARLPAEIVWNLPLTSAEKYFPKDLPGGTPLGPNDVVLGPRPNGARNVSSADYPSQSANNGEQGIVVLYVLVGVDGRVQDTRLGGTSGFIRLDNAALNIVKRFEYFPGRVNGAPSPLWWTLTVSFVFRGDRLGNCISSPVITEYQKRPRVPAERALPRYSRWTLVNAEGKIDESLLLTEKGWMSLDPELVAIMNQQAQYPTKGRPAHCWIYDGVDPMMEG